MTPPEEKKRFSEEDWKVAEHILMEVKGWFETVVERPGETFTIRLGPMIVRALDNARKDGYEKGIKDAAEIPANTGTLFGHPLMGPTEMKAAILKLLDKKTEENK